MNGTLETIKEDMSKYESDSDTEKSDINTNIKNSIQDISNEQIMSAKLMILEELKLCSQISITVLINLMYIYNNSCYI